MITNAATNANNVVGPVYVATFVPDEGEPLADIESDSKESVLKTLLMQLQYPSGEGEETAVEFAILESKLPVCTEVPRAGCDVIEPGASLVHESLFGRPAHQDPRSRRRRDAKERGRQNFRGEPLLHKTLRGGSPRRQATR